jgi:hypothetical protein
MELGPPRCFKKKYRAIHKLSNHYFIKTHCVKHVYASTLNQILFNQSVCIAND